MLLDDRHIKYVRDHWQGKHALLFALAVNLILIRALILFADRYTLPPYIPDRIPALIATIAFILFFFMALFLSGRWSACCAPPNINQAFLPISGPL